MNHMMIPTNVVPNYNYLAAENAFLRQNIEYKDAVLVEQQATIQKFQADVAQLSDANMTLKIERDKAVADAARWKVMKQIIKTQGNEREVYEVTKIVDKELENDRARRKARVE